MHPVVCLNLDKMSDNAILIMAHRSHPVRPFRLMFRIDVNRPDQALFPKDAWMVQDARKPKDAHLCDLHKVSPLMNLLTEEP
jgi:hypothetical protein